MVNGKNRISGFLPEKIKRSLRPVYKNWQKMMRRSFKSRTFNGPSVLAIGTFCGFEVAYRINTVDEAVIGHSFENDIFFSGVPEYQPGEGDVILDIGAHIGTFSLLASSKVGVGKVYAIEASEESFNYLRVNIALNRLANISAHHLALSDKTGTSTLYHSDSNWGHSTVKKLSTASETVISQTLSDFLERNRINECHFMKLNCEGGEFPILLSTPSRILQRFGVILTLYHCDLWSDNTEADLISHLESSGFNCVVRNQKRNRGWIISTKMEEMSPHD